jgi:DNA-binding MarR family transcriptional regulator
MGTTRSLAHELADLALILMEIIKQELKAAAGDDAPTLTQFKMLMVIRGGVCHVGKLSEAFCISQPAASIMVEGMVKDGLLRKAPLARDRRHICLRLTPRATARVDAAYKRAFANIDARLASLSATKKKALASQLRDIAALISRAESSASP